MPLAAALDRGSNDGRCPAIIEFHNYYILEIINTAYMAIVSIIITHRYIPYKWNTILH